MTTRVGYLHVQLSKKGRAKTVISSLTAIHRVRPGGRADRSKLLKLPDLVFSDHGPHVPRVELDADLVAQRIVYKEIIDVVGDCKSGTHSLSRVQRLTP